MEKEALISQYNWSKKAVPSGYQCFPHLSYPRTLSANSSFLSQLNIEPSERKSATSLPYLLMLRKLEQNGNVSSLRSWQEQQQGNLLRITATGSLLSPFLK